MLQHLQCNADVLVASVAPLPTPCRRTLRAPMVDALEVQRHPEGAGARQAGQPLGGLLLGRDSAAAALALACTPAGVGHHQRLQTLLMLARTGLCMCEGAPLPPAACACTCLCPWLCWTCGLPLVFHGSWRCLACTHPEGGICVSVAGKRRYVGFPLAARRLHASLGLNLGHEVVMPCSGGRIMRRSAAAGGRLAVLSGCGCQAADQCHIALRMRPWLLFPGGLLLVLSRLHSGKVGPSTHAISKHEDSALAGKQYPLQPVL